MDRIMREEKQTAQEPLLRRVTGCSKLGRPLSFFLIFAVSYTIGFFSATFPFNNTRSAPPPTTFTITSNVTGNATFPDHERYWSGCTKPPLPTMLVRRTIIDRLYNGTSPYDNFPPPHIAPLLQTKKHVQGWGSTGAVFENLIWKVKPRIIVEVGTFLGTSAIHMAELTIALGLRTQIICIDDFRGWPEFRSQFTDIGILNGDVMLLYQFMSNVVSANVAETIIPIPFSSDSALEKLCAWGIMADLVEVDAGHDFHAAWSDINRAYNIMRPGGVLFGHDYFNANDDYGVRRAVDRFAQLKGLKVRAEGEHWILE